MIYSLIASNPPLLVIESVAKMNSLKSMYPLLSVSKVAKHLSTKSEAFSKDLYNRFSLFNRRWFSASQIGTCLDALSKCNLRFFFGYRDWKDGGRGSFSGRGRSLRPWNDPGLRIFNQDTQGKFENHTREFFKQWDRTIGEGECFYAQMDTFLTSFSR